MDLFEWRQKKTDNIREQVKDQIREGFDLTSHFLLSAQDLEDIREEILIEEYSEVVTDFDEVSLEEEVSDSTEPQVFYEFSPWSDGAAMNIEMEFDLNLFEMDFVKLGKIRDTIFAEDYEIEIDENANKAKVVFQRSKGEITKKKTCGPGMRLVGNRCLPQTGSQKSKERQKGIKLKRAKKASGAAVKKRAAIKAKITKKRVAGRSRSYSSTTN